MPGRGEARQSRHGTAGPGPERLGKARPGSLGSAGLGRAWQGKAVSAWQGPEGIGPAWTGATGHGTARQRQSARGVAQLG